MNLTATRRVDNRTLASTKMGRVHDELPISDKHCLAIVCLLVDTDRNAAMVALLIMDASRAE